MKNNIKRNKNRIVFWGLILIICAVLSVVGINKYEEGYGKKGQARLKLIPITNEFNKQDSIIRYGDIKAVTKGNKIVVTYNPEKNKKKKFVYSYSTINGHEVISNTYSSEDIYLGELIAGGMMDSIYMLHGGTESILSTYRYSAFNTTSIENGITLSSGSDSTITLDINANVIELCSNLDLEKAVTGYITQGDLTNLIENLNENKSFRIHKKNITIYIVENENTYDIYAENLDQNSNDDLYNSLINVIKLLNDESLTQIRSTGNRLDRDSKDTLFEIRTEATFTELDVFNTDSKIMRVIIPIPESRK